MQLFRQTCVNAQDVWNTCAHISMSKCFIDTHVLKQLPRPAQPRHVLVEPEVLCEHQAPGERNTAVGQLKRQHLRPRELQQFHLVVEWQLDETCARKWKT